MFQFFITIFVSINFVYLVQAENLIKQNSPENIEKIAEDDHPELYSGQVEGDMILTPLQKDLLYNTERRHRTGLINLTRKWTNNEIPYKIAKENFTWVQEHLIIMATNLLMEVSCVKFVPYDEAYHKNYILIVGHYQGCYSYIGMNGGQQIFNLAPSPIGKGCFKFYTIVHEFIHALGFVHMHCASERDEYIKVVEENIISNTSHNFVKYSKNVITQYGIKYDYGSVMHYPATAFSKNNKSTIIPLKSLNGEFMGQRERLSDLDIARINAMYCSDKKVNTDNSVSKKPT